MIERDVLRVIDEQLTLHSMKGSYSDRSAEYIEKNNVFIVRRKDIPRMAESALLPEMLFAMGRKEHLRKFRIGIVGTRKPDEYAVRTVKEIVRRYKNRDVATVSGFAEGIDSLVHETSLDNQVPTIAVLPGGFAENYPASNEKLRERTRRDGLLLSEYSPYIKPLKLNFIQRNHIIAAMSDVIIITQGAMKSGTLSTLSQALKLKRQIFALPGEITNKLSFAPNYAIFRGAVPIYSKNILPGISKETRGIVKLTEDEEALMVLIRKYRDVNAILNSGEMTQAAVVSTLTSLEMKGLIMKGFNNKISVLEE